MNEQISALHVAQRLREFRNHYHAYGEITIELPDGMHVDLTVEDVLELADRIAELEGATEPAWRKAVRKVIG